MPEESPDTPPLFEGEVTVHDLSRIVNKLGQTVDDTNQDTVMVRIENPDLPPNRQRKMSLFVANLLKGQRQIERIADVAEYGREFTFLPYTELFEVVQADGSMKKVALLTPHGINMALYPNTGIWWTVSNWLATHFKQFHNPDFVNEKTGSCYCGLKAETSVSEGAQKRYQALKGFEPASIVGLKDMIEKRQFQGLGNKRARFLLMLIDGLKAVQQEKSV